MSGSTLLPALPIDLPLLPLRAVVVFPHMVIPLFVGRPKSIKALESAMSTDRRIMLVAQKTAAKDEPADTHLFAAAMGDRALDLRQVGIEVGIAGSGSDTGFAGALVILQGLDQGAIDHESRRGGIACIRMPA